MKEAIEKYHGPCVILAGAGTGKTYTIVEKIKYLIKNKIYEPEKIVCITFSNEAANNILMRTRKALELEYGREPIIKTFHAFSADILRKYGNLIGLNQDFKILDPDEAKVVLHRSLRVEPYYCRKYISTIGTAKDLGISLDMLQEYLDEQIKKFIGIDIEKRLESLQFEFQILYLQKDKEKKKKLVSEITVLQEIIGIKKFISTWRAYEKIKIKSKYQDYADLNNNALILLSKFPEITGDFSYIIVDEFQDTNKIQLDFLFAIARQGNITIVGDLNQSIYQFRGAFKENYSLFKKHFNISEKEVYNLDKSFRSPNKILKAAHKLVQHNYRNKEECFLVENFEGREGEKIEVNELKNGKEEARKVVELVQREIGLGARPEEICVLCRTHQQARIIKQAFSSANIDYSAISKSSLLQQPSVKITIDYLTILDKINRKAKGGNQEWWDLLYLMNFSADDMIILGKFLKEFRNENELSLLIIEKIQILPLSEQGKFLAKLMLERIKKLASLDLNDSVALIPEIYRINGFLFEQKSIEGKERMMHLNAFLELAKNHQSLYANDVESFLNYLQILNNLDIEIPSASISKGGVQLMTLHATKGLEYKIVIITNMAQKRFPIGRVENNFLLPRVLFPDVLEENKNNISEEDVRNYASEHQLLEERRLCYVAFTRAKEKLIITYAKEYAGKKAYPSQFLYEIDFQKNPAVVYYQDNLDKYNEPILNKKFNRSFNFISESGQFESLVHDIVNSDTGKLKNLTEQKDKVYSPSALLLFSECQKQYEYQYIFNMPEKKTLSWEAMRLGSFVHRVLEKGVKDGFKSVKEFLDYGKELILEEEWASIDWNESEHMIKVFFERNKSKYNSQSRTEQVLNTELQGIGFTGFADRIDKSPEGLEIIDYKTGKFEVAPRNRRWQLGYYALAAGKLDKVYKITLDMLKQENPLEFILDDKGNAIGQNSDRMDFNIFEVEEELVSTAKQIIDCREKGFKPCPLEKNCAFCNEYVYRL